MQDLFGWPVSALMSQLLLGLINGTFYAVLSLGLAVIFGMLNIINFAHGAMYMLGAFLAWLILDKLGLGYWWALLIVPLVVGFIGILMERFLISRIRQMDHLYGLLLTFGIALMVQSAVRIVYGSSGLPYGAPTELAGGVDLGFMFLPYYRAWVVLVATGVCLVTWLTIEKTPLGAILRAAIENPSLVQALGINVPRIVTLTYGVGVAIAALAGVLVAPIYSVNPSMGSEIIIKVFAMVVIGGMGSIAGSVVTGFTMGLFEAATKLIYPQAASTVVFLVMIVVLMVRPQGLFGQSD